MWKLEERAGLSEGYYSKMLHGERQASLLVLQQIVDAIFSDGFTVKFKESDSREVATAGIANLNENLRTYQRGRMLNLASLGGFKRAESLTPAQRSAIAWKAARVRWDRNNPHNSQPPKDRD